MTYEFSWSTISEIQVILFLSDSSRNRTEDPVSIEIRSFPTTTITPTFTTITPTTVEMNYPVLILLVVIALALVWRRFILRRR